MVELSVYVRFPLYVLAKKRVSSRKLRRTKLNWLLKNSTSKRRLSKPSERKYPGDSTYREVEDINSIHYITQAYIHSNIMNTN